MGSKLVLRTMPCLAWSARAFSLVKQPNKGALEDLSAYDTPLWHNALFVLIVGALLEDDTLLNHLAPSWKTIYAAALAGITSRPPGDSAPQPLQNQNPMGDDTPPPPAFWGSWNKPGVALFLAQPHTLPSRASQEVWQAFHKCPLPAAHKDFIHRAL